MKNFLIFIYAVPIWHIKNIISSFKLCAEDNNTFEYFLQYIYAIIVIPLSFIWATITSILKIPPFIYLKKKGKL